MATYHYVMRTHSHNDRQQLWKVMSRRIADKHDAQSWLEWCEVEEKRDHPRSKHTFFLITKEDDS